MILYYYTEFIEKCLKMLFTILNLLPIYLQQNKLPQMICSLTLTSSFLTVELVNLYILFLIYKYISSLLFYISSQCGILFLLYLNPMSIGGLNGTQYSVQQFKKFEKRELPVHASKGFTRPCHL